MLSAQIGILPEGSNAEPEETSPVNNSLGISIDDFINEMDTPREDVNAGKVPGEEDGPGSEPPPAPDTAQLTAEQKSLREKKARWEAKFLVKNNDKLHTFFCSLISGDDDTDHFKASQEDLDDLMEEVYEMRKDSDKHLPPWIGVLMGMALIYVPKYKEAISDRKINKALMKRAIDAETEKQLLMEKLRLENLEHQNKEKAKTDQTPKTPVHTAKEPKA